MTCGALCDIQGIFGTNEYLFKGTFAQNSNFVLPGHYYTQ